MLIEGSVASNKTDILIEKYAELLNCGVEASRILVIVQNSNLKNLFIDKTFEKLTVECVEKLRVYSFFGLVYNTVNDNWASVENSNPYGGAKILPSLAGLEVSQFIMKELLKEIPFKGYNSKKSLLHQLFRRYQLIVQNNLSDDEVQWRSNVLKESFAEDAKLAIKKFLAKTLELRDLDYLRQSLIFNHICKTTNYFDDIDYLIVDDGDEITPICFDFIKFLAPKLKDVFIAFDKKGGSRTGYLSADRTAVWEFENLFNQKSEKVESITKLKADAETLNQNAREEKNGILKHFVLQSLSKRASMIDLAVEKIKELLKRGIKASEITVITPLVDDMLKFSFKESIPNNVNPLFLSGSEKLIQNRIVLSVINVLKLNSSLRNNLSEFDIRSVLCDYLGIPVKYLKEILENFENTKTLCPHDFEFEEFGAKYNALLDLIKDFETTEDKLSEQVLEIYERLAKFTRINPDEINKFNFFVGQLRDFEDIYGEDFKNKKDEIIVQIENSIISENPYSTLEIRERDLVIGTPQKIIDNQIRTKYQLWLDVSSDEWIKNDTGPMYNAWVFQRGWEKDEFTVEDNIKLSREKNGKILRKLTLCADEAVFAYSSLYDGMGNENFGGIEKYICTGNETAGVQKPAKQIIPRKDQEPVLKYKAGKMAISAVPGAGKTTILLALILKLLDNDIPAENIFVLTYMDSAARNFREKIKNIRHNSTQLPNISTIHGLALRILKENSNFERLGLSSDFEICDDTQKTRIIREITAKQKLKKTEANDFVQAVSIFKTGGGKFDRQVTDPQLIKFKEFYSEYSLALSSNNLIDYDDMMISAVRLLEENPDILKYYQEICRYIIEDEAQDSSFIQQQLIGLLSGKHGNLIRCGDINQAITVTFSNADTDGFRKFIKEASDVSMDCSQRCTKDVYELANRLVDNSFKNDDTKDAFHQIFMHPVEGENPVCDNALNAEIFKTFDEEKNYVLKSIQNIFKSDSKAAAAILVRNNSQAAIWLNILNSSGLTAITRSESLGQKSIFRTIFAVMNMILKPFDNNVIADSYEILAETGRYRQRLSTKIRNCESPFIQLNCDDINNLSLEQFYWDLTYWLSFPHLCADELAVKIGLSYFSSEIEKSNVYLISTLIKRLSINNKNFASIVERLDELAKKPTLSGYRFFSEEGESDREFFKGKVQVMTLHKSKGDEFDHVFIPEMSETSLPILLDYVKIKSSDFIEKVRQLNPSYIPKTDKEMRKILLAENLRLMYVGITRAKKGLHFSVSTSQKYYGIIKEQVPNAIFDEISGGKTYA